MVLETLKDGEIENRTSRLEVLQFKINAFLRVLIKVDLFSKFHFSPLYLISYSLIHNKKYSKTIA